MPYIKQSDRTQYDKIIDELVNTLEQNDFDEGHLNYIVSRIVVSGFKRGASYRYINKVLGVLDAVGKEFYRRWAGPYEDVKVTQNGDIKYD